MSRLMRLSESWFRLLGRLYPEDFRDEMGAALVETYMDRAQVAVTDGGTFGVFALWFRALLDSVRNGLAERMNPAASWRRAGRWGRDAEIVSRRLARSPLFAFTTIGTLTVGLGLFAVVYTAVQKILLDPMPYENSSDLYSVWRDYGPIADISRGALSGPDIIELQRESKVIQDAAALQPFLGGIFSAGESTEPFEIAVTWTTPNLFRLLGITPSLGRTFAADETGPGRSNVMVLTHRLWTRLGADRNIVGSDVRLQGRPFTVIGVLPPDFHFVRSEAAAPPQRVDAFVPFERRLADVDARNGAYTALVRAHPGTPPAQVAVAIDSVGRTVDARDFSGRGLKLYPVGLKADVIARIGPALVVLGASGLVLLLMLTVNLASVLLARAAEREHQFAVSRALGADEAAVLRSTLFEGVLLGLTGGTLGAMAAVWGTRALAALAPLDLPRREALELDWRIAGVVVITGGLIGLLAAAPPAVWAARTSLTSLLAASAVRGGGGHGRLRRSMIVVQVALSIVLLATGALVTRSFERLLRTDPGFRPEGVLTVRLRTPPEFFPTINDALAFQDRVQKAFAAIPGVTGASATATLPLSGAAFQIEISVPGAPLNTGDPRRDGLVTDFIGVRPGYIEVMGMRLRSGRAITEASAANEAVIDTALAQRYFGGRDASGAKLRVGDREFTVTGVVDHARLYDLHADGRPQVYVRSADFGIRPLFYVIRSTRDPQSLMPDVHAAVRRLDGRVPVGEPKVMQEIVDATRSPQLIGASLIGAFAVGALLLAVMGLFGVVSGSVTRRRHELAVRLALGAEHGRVLRLVVREGAMLVLVGLLIGAPGVYIATEVARGLLVGVSPADPIALLAATSGLLLVTVLTCYLSARRVLTIQPAQLLRHD